MNRFNLPHRWVIVLSASLVLLGILTFVTRDTTPGADTGPALRAESNRPRGARALMLWMRELGYEPRTTAFRAFEVDASARLLLAFNPTYTFAEDDLSEITDWVNRGGVLLIVSDHQNPLADRFGARIRGQAQPFEAATPLQPVFTHPPVTRVTINGRALVTFDDSSWIPVLGMDGEVDRPVMGMRPYGDGWVFILSDHFPVSNEGIADDENAALMIGVLGAIPTGSTVVFDGYHQGLTEHGTLMARLIREPWGWALLYISGLIFVYLATSGRRFGRVTPVAPIAALRSRGEYVTTIGGLLRRGRHLDWLRQQYATQVKRALGTRFGVRADQPAREFSTAMAARRADTNDLGHVLERLEHPGALDEQATIALIREVDTIQKRMTGQR